MGFPPRGMVIEASFRITCEDFDFRLRYSPGIVVADFPSLGMLARAGKMSRDIGELIADLPPLPPFAKSSTTPSAEKKPTRETEYLVAVKSRPVGKIDFSGGKARFVPTPLRFFRKV